MSAADENRFVPTRLGNENARSGRGLDRAVTERPERRAPATIARARALRRGDNMAEAIIWNELKAGRLAGHKFVRQMPVGPYFADFCCRKARLIVELDGSQHADSEHDRRRDAFLTRAGYSVLRFWSHDALRSTTQVCETILAVLAGRLSEETDSADLRFKPALRRHR